MAADQIVARIRSYLPRGAQINLSEEGKIEASSLDRWASLDSSLFKFIRHGMLCLSLFPLSLTSEKTLDCNLSFSLRVSWKLINFTFNVEHFVLSDAVNDRIFIVFGNSNRILTKMYPLQKMMIAFAKNKPSVTKMLHANSLFGYRYLNKTSPAQSLYLVTLAWDSATTISRVIAFFLRTLRIYIYRLAPQCDSFARFDIANKIIKITSKSPWFPSGWKVERPWL